jgi:ATP-dependent Clp protease adapter protein ClpS
MNFVHFQGPITCGIYTKETKILPYVAVVQHLTNTSNSQQLL